MRLFIENIEIKDFDITTELAVTFTHAVVTKIEGTDTGYTKTLKVPITPETRRKFGFPDDLHIINFFNQKGYLAKVEDEGIVVASGTCFLQRVESNYNSASYYHINIIGGGLEWSINQRTNYQSQIKLDFEQTFNEQSIIDSWNGENTLCRWIPVLRAPFSYIENRERITRKMEIWDYHPFINVKAALIQIFKDGGYDVVSKFIDDGGMDELYMSGTLNKADVDDQKKNWDFYAGRFLGNELKAQTSHIMIFGSNDSDNKGTIVDTANPDEPLVISGPGGDSYYVSGAFDNGNNGEGAVSINSNGVITFAPNSEVSIGFLLKLYYKTQVIFNRYDTSEGRYYVEPICYSKILLGGTQSDINIPEALYKYNSNYRKAGYMWYLDGYPRYYLLNGNRTQEDETDIAVIEFDSYDYDGLRLTINTARVGYDDEKYYTIQGKYALIKKPDPNASDSHRIYVGNNIAPSGEIPKGEYPAVMRVYYCKNSLDIETNIELPVRKTEAGQQRIISNLMFTRNILEASPVELDFELYSGTNLTPLFPITGIGIGDIITPESVLSNQLMQLELLNSVKHLFNLNIYTDVLRKIAFIEPKWNFYTGPMVDWSDKLDLSKPIDIEELGFDISRIFTLGYSSPDYSVENYNDENNTDLGTYNTEIKNVFAKKERNPHTNVMFQASIIKNGSYPNAPSAKLLHVNSDSNTNMVVNFDTRIVKYEGLKDLPEGESLEFPSNNKYPQISFIEAGLCFEDRDGVQGLHKYYDNSVENYNRSKRITAYLHLKSKDVETFARQNRLQKDLRATFVLEIDREKVYCRLESINDFKGDGRSTKCVFIKKI